MIQYSLVCDNSHSFEAWFKNASAFDEQVEVGIVTCPICATSNVNKALMAPALARKSTQTSTTAKNVEAAPTAGQNQPDETQSVALSAGHPDQAKLRQMMRTLRDKITSEADYVGDKFAAEARKIHDQEVEPRGIYGEATPQETANLIEDGIDILPLPALPEEQN